MSGPSSAAKQAGRAASPAACDASAALAALAAEPGAEPRIVMAHGGGGELMQRLIRDCVMPILGEAGTQRGNRLAAEAAAMNDAAIIPWSGPDVVFTTDSFVVTPLEFPGGDIGRLAVCGTVNDLSVMGAEPVALSLGLILEEGLPLRVLERVLRSIATAAGEAGVAIVTGDTKVVERRGVRSVSDAPGMMINTAGIGRRLGGARPDARLIRVGDRVLINGPIGEHGLAVLSVRQGLEFETPITTDAAPLNGLISAIWSAAEERAGCADPRSAPRSGAGPIRFMRDATRGGVAGVLADICDASGLSLQISERSVPVSPAVRHASEMLGLDPLTIANEGRLVAVVAPEACEAVLETMRRHSLGRHAACMGIITESQPPLAELITQGGGRRIIQRPYGEDLPRIC
ncbi:MAG: Carbamoyl dehydratase HypE [Phycisphaerae bacterium]|nr:Carbamoyl dehydratase HypE [Phycisphaerae bacterium]